MEETLHNEQFQTLEGKGWSVVEEPGSIVRLQPPQDDGILHS